MKLSNEQKKLAHTDSKKALGIAPAGSGKTRVLISRVGYLITKCNVSPYEICSFSFTRKAAGELKERLQKEIGNQADNATLGTIHGVSLNCLQRFGELVNLKPGKITVYGSFEEQFLLKDVATELGYHDGHKWTKVKKGDVSAAFKLFYTTGFITTEEVSVKINVLMNAFFARCKENNALTYGTILTTFLRLIPKIAGYLNFRYILADEVQDQNPIQWQILNDLCKYCGASLFAIGDPRQSIYAFNGADPEYLIRNQGLFDVYNLKDNYRSSATIVEAANKLIGHNGMDMGEPMEAKRDLGKGIMIAENVDSEKLVDFCRVYQNSDCAVLSRIHGLLKKLSRLLDDAGIKHEYIGKKSGLVKSEEFIRFHAFLKLIVNPFDNFSFLLIRDYLGVSGEEYGEIRLKSAQDSKSHFQIWKETRMDGANEIFEWFASSEIGDFITVIDWFLDIEWGFDPEPIFTFIYSWMGDNPDCTIDQYLNWLATFDVQDEIKEESPGLKLCTVHSTKGLEFPTVIAIGFNEGIFPDKRSVKENKLDEERNLAYVCMTRAENQLILTSRPPKKDDSGRISGEASRFISEALK